MTKELIVNLIKKNILALQKEGVFPKFKIPARQWFKPQALAGGSEISVSRTSDAKFGDFTTNAAMHLVGALHRNPVEIANLIKNKIEDDGAAKKLLKKVEAAGPGFINFYLSDHYFQGQAAAILKDRECFGENNLGQGKKLQVEFISANPTGPLTLGNGRGGLFGDVVANVLDRSGYEVWREYYVNDRGNQIKILGESYLAQAGFLPDQPEHYKNLKFEGLPESGLKKYIRDPEKLGYRISKIFLNNYIKPIIKKLGIEFCTWFSEKSLYKKGAVNKVLKLLAQKRLTYEKDGALWFRVKEFGDSEDRVLIKQDGEETYFLSDIAYHWDKFKIHKFGKVIDVWGADHHGYAPRLKAALKAIGLPAENLDIIIMQLVRLMEDGKEIRMSKRSGTYVTLQELVDEVGVDAARFFFLMYAADTHLDFDLKLAKEKSEKNPVYYVQYAYARIHSILAKSKIKNQKSKLQFKSQNFGLLTHPSEIALIKELDYFPELVFDIAQNYQVHKLPHYALELARSFHAFYRDCRVIGVDKDLSQARFGLILATRIVLQNLLGLMGISAPEKM